MTIVLAKVEMTGLRPTGKLRFDGGNYFPMFEPSPEAKACIWLGKAKQSDVAKAEAYAQTEGYSVFIYNNERDPLGRAKNDAMKAFCNAEAHHALSADRGYQHNYLLDE